MLAVGVFLVPSILTVVYGSTVLPMTATAPNGCMHEGTHYNIGDSFQPSPCEHCYCTPDGNVACAIADCFFVPCVDAVHDPKQCCPVCPNGKHVLHTELIQHKVK